MATTTAKTVKKTVKKAAAKTVKTEAKARAKPAAKSVKTAAKTTAKPAAKSSATTAAQAVAKTAKTPAKTVARPAQPSAKIAANTAFTTAVAPAILAAKPDYWDDALVQLVKRDRILKKIIPRFPDIWLTTRGNPFITLARSICGQQISVKAAESVWQRVLLECGKRPSPASVQKAGLERLRAAGLSGRKAEYILDLSTHFSDKLVQPSKWVRMPDEEIIEELTAIRGIGRWTAEMFLIFNLQRPDVLPLDDVGLLNAISLHYFSGEPVSRFEAREVAQGWQPFRTVATWYLWRSLDPVPVEY